MSVKVKLNGTLRKIAGRESFEIEVKNFVTVKELMERLTDFLAPSFRRFLVDPELCDPRPNTLILVNGKEISVLDGIDTKVYPNDEVVFIPVSHGG